jgi:hypothetical protein
MSNLVNFDLMERATRLCCESRMVRRSKPRSRFLNLPPGHLSDPKKSIRETAYLMQLRLQLEEQARQA